MHLLPTVYRYSDYWCVRASPFGRYLFIYKTENQMMGKKASFLNDCRIYSMKKITKLHTSARFINCRFQNHVHRHQKRKPIFLFHSQFVGNISWLLAIVWGICCSWKIENDFQIKSWKTLYSRYIHSQPLGFINGYTYIYFISSTIHGYGIKIIDDKYEIKSLLYFCYHVRISMENPIEFLWFVHSFFRNLKEKRVERKGE